jgi:hypothetical protein
MTSWHDIEEWLLEHCVGTAEIHHGEPKSLGPRVLFEKEEDATMFALRWGG